MPLGIGFTRFKFTLSGKFTRFQFTPYNINAYRAKFTRFQFILKKENDILGIGCLLSEIYFEPKHNASAHCPHGLFTCGLLPAPISLLLCSNVLHSATSQQQEGTVCTNQSIDKNHLYTYADAYADLLWEKNNIRLLKSTAEVVQVNRATALVQLW